MRPQTGQQPQQGGGGPATGGGGGAAPRPVNRGSVPKLYFPANEGETPQVAQFRLLRERLLELESSRVLLVTSAEAGEGKTTVAANLALCLAEFGRTNVLLVEANFRQPVLSQVFNAPNPTCFARQLMYRHKGGAPPAPYRPTTLPGQSVHLLACSPGMGAGISVAWPAFQSVVTEFKGLNWIGHIVIDGPPTLGSADAKLLAQQSDTVLLTAIAKRTRAKKLSQAAAQLAPAPVAGVVLLTDE